MYVSMTPHGESGKVLHCSQDDKDRKFEIQLYDEKSVIDGFIEQLYFPTFKGGTEQLLPINTSTPTTSNFRGTIEYPSGEVESEFVYRESPTSEDGRGHITEIKGNTIKFNQLIENGNFASASGWSKTSNESISASDNILTIEKIANDGQSLQTFKMINTISNHTYLVIADFKADNTETIMMRLGNITGNPQKNVSSSWTTISGTKTIENGGSTEFNFFVLNNESSSIGSKFYVKNAMCVDLSDIFGIGNEPTTVEAFKTWLSNNIGLLPYYDYTPGSLISFNGTGIKTTGKNLLEIPTYSTIWVGLTITSNKDDGILIKGTATTSGSISEVGNFVKLIKGKTYTISGINGGSVSTFYIQATNEEITQELFVITNGSYQYIPTQDETIFLRVRVISGAVIDTLIKMQCEFGSTATEYEPYTESTLSLPISAYFPTGMKSAGTAYDKLTGKQADKVISEVIDLGNDWNWYKSDLYFYTDVISSLPFLPSVFQVGNILCNKYNTTSVADITEERKDKSIALTPTSQQIIVYDSALENLSASDFKTAMSGVYLIYELANPIITNLKSASLVCKGTELPIYNNEVSLIEDVTNEAGTFDCKVKLHDGDDVAYSEKLSLYVERKPL